MTIHKALHLRYDVNKLYVTRKKKRTGLYYGGFGFNNLGTWIISKEEQKEINHWNQEQQQRVQTEKKEAIKSRNHKWEEKQL